MQGDGKQNNEQGDRCWKTNKTQEPRGVYDNRQLGDVTACPRNQGLNRDNDHHEERKENTRSDEGQKKAFKDRAHVRTHFTPSIRVTPVMWT